MPRPRKLTPRRLHGLSDADKCAVFLETLRIPEGPKAGEQLRLAPFQKSFVEGALCAQIDTAVLSVGRGNAKSALSAGIALGALLGIWDRQPRRDVIIAARTRDQARVAWSFCEGFCQSLPEDYQAALQFRRSPRLEIAFEGDGGGHVLRAIAADGKSALGSGPTFVLMDERGHWPTDK
ncbi:MAG: terminase large subunit, partial [Pseudomonadota bacterium]